MTPEELKKFEEYQQYMLGKSQQPVEDLNVEEMTSDEALGKIIPKPPQQDRLVDLVRTGPQRPSIDTTQFQGAPLLKMDTTQFQGEEISPKPPQQDRLLDLVRGGASKPPENAPAPKKAPAAPINSMLPEVPEEPVEQPFNGLDFGENKLASQQGLKDAQNRQNDMQFLANMNRAAGQFAGGLSQTDYKGSPIADAVERQGKQQVDNYKEQVDFQKQDPGSAYSKGLKDYFKNKLGMEIRGDASGAELEKIMPLAVREYEAKLAREQSKTQRAEDRDLKRELAGKDREFKKELLGAKAEEKATAGQEKASAKEKEQQNSFIERTSKQLEKHTTNLTTLRNAKSAVDAAVKNPSSIKDVGALYSFIKALDPGSVVREGEVELANRASGLFGGLTLKLSQLTSDPKLITSRNLKDIQDSVTQLHDLADSEYDLRRQTAYKRAKSRKITEDRFGEFDPYADSASTSKSDAGGSKEDEEAIAWAKKNPKDPRASQILKLHGM